MDLLDVTFTILKVLGFFAAILIAAIFILPKVITPRIWKSTGSVEGIATASFFGAAAIAGTLGLSPIVGAFAVGMALSASKVFEKIENFIILCLFSERTKHALYFNINQASPFL